MANKIKIGTNVMFINYFVRMYKKQPNWFIYSYL